MNHPHGRTSDQRSTHGMSKIDLRTLASAIPTAWQSNVVGSAAGANIKVLRMDASEYPTEQHGFDEAFLVIEGQMNLKLNDEIVQVAAGQLYIVPAGVPHAVAPGSHGTLVIVDRA